MIYVMTYSDSTSTGVTFKGYSELSTYAKSVGVSPTQLYNTGRKITDPRHVPFVETANGLRLVKVTKKMYESVNTTQELVVTEEPKDEQTISYSDIKNSEGFQNDNACCSVVACAVAANVSFEKAQKAMADAGRVKNKGVSVMQIKRGMEFLGKEMKLDIPSVEKVQGRTINQATRMLGEGTFMVIVRGHVACIKNGVCEDWTAGRRHKVQTVYKVA